MNQTLTITVNGTIRTVAQDCTVADLLTTLKLDPKFLAIERNRELVPRTQHSNCQLLAGDVLEIVTLVGGG